MMEPLVSIAVITYNSSNYIIDALESVKLQTYNNVELIVSDDCSTDNTLTLANTWIKKNASRFVATKLVKTPCNLGVSGNCQNALNAASGEWFMPLAYDDVLDFQAIKVQLDFISSNPEAKVVLGQTASFVNDISKCQKVKNTFCHVFFGDSITAKQQFNILIKVFVGSGPGMFYNTEALRLVGYDLRFPLQEDHALFIHLTKAGYKIYYNPALVVYKRKVANSIMHQHNEHAIYGNNAIRQIMEYKGEYQSEQMSPFWKFLFGISLAMRKRVITSGNDRCLFKCRFFYFVQRIFDPMRWYLLFLVVKDKIIGFANQ